MERETELSHYQQSPPAAPHHVMFVARMLRPAQNGVPQTLGVSVLSRQAAAFCRGRRREYHKNWNSSKADQSQNTIPSCSLASQPVFLCLKKRKTGWLARLTVLIHVGLKMLKAVTELTEAATYLSA